MIKKLKLGMVLGLSAWMYLAPVHANLAVTLGSHTLDLPYWQTQAKSQGAVIMVQGEGGFADDLLPALAAQLQTLRWSVVIIKRDRQTDNLAQALPEIISTLRIKKNPRVIVLHYGEHLQETLSYFSKPRTKQINGLILLSSENQDAASKSQVKPYTFPIYDIVAQFDYDSVLEQFKQRKKTARTATSYYHSLVLPGANHDYNHEASLLARYLNGWMGEIRPVIPVTIPATL